eukprot:m.905156 g.905156  ORF g.905156 m.905156 type:complete len:88 (+) comp23695_c1_seq1:132-395(+)
MSQENPVQAQLLTTFMDDNGSDAPSSGLNRPMTSPIVCNHIATDGNWKQMLCFSLTCTHAKFLSRGFALEVPRRVVSPTVFITEAGR